MRILFAIRDRISALVEIDGAVIQEGLTWPAGLACEQVVRTVPRADAQRPIADAEVLVKPVAAHRCGADHSTIFVILPKNFIGFSALPRRRAEVYPATYKYNPCL